MTEFKKISDVDVIDTLTDSDNVVIIDSDGALKQTSSGNLGMDITKTEVVEAPEETDNLVLVSNGTVKQVSAATFAAASGGGVEPIYLVPKSTGGSYGSCTLDDGSDLPANLYDLFIAGTPILVAESGSGAINKSKRFLVIAASTSGDQNMFYLIDGTSSKTIYQNLT